jgi:hypothetical protein
MRPACPHAKPKKQMKIKAPTPYIKARGAQSGAVMVQLANNPPGWTAEGFLSPQNFVGMLEGILPLENALALREAELALAAGQWDEVLNPWHDESVTVLAMARPKFRDTNKAPAWRNLRADSRSRDRIMSTGKDIIGAWQTSDAAWVPKPGLTLAAYTARQTAAVAKAAAHNTADKLADIKRGELNDLLNEVYDLSVRWYEIATGYWPKDSVEGSLIRTIPTSYNPNAVPGKLEFKLHLSPSPNTVQLAWEAPRGQHYDIYALAPGATEFVKILGNVTQTTWQGQGLAAGQWAFKGEARNADGAGEPSEVIVLPVLAAMAA